MICPLTAGTDVINGTAGNDTINAVLQADGASGTTIQPGDVINGGAGTDTLNVTVAGDIGTTSYTIAAVQANGVENVLVSNFNTDNNTDLIVATSLMDGVAKVGASSSSASGDTAFTGMKNMVAAEMRNGAGDLTLTYDGAQVVTGTADSQSLTVSNMTAGTFTADGIEAISITSETAKSTLTAVVSNALKSVTVTGAADLKIANALDFASNGTATAPGAVVDASAFTGKLEITTTANEVLNVKGGSGDDTFNLGSLTKDDAIVGGEGTDTINMTAADLTTEFAKVSGIEKVAFTAGTASATMDVSKLSAGVTTVQMDLSDGTDGTTPARVVGTFSNLEGQTVVLKHTVANAADTDGSDGTEYVITNKVDTSADAVNVVLDAIGVTSTANNSTSDFGVDVLDVGNFETINLTSKKSTTVTANEVKSLTDSSATALNISGDADLTITQTGTKLTKLDASGLAGKLNVTLGANKVAVTGTAKDDTFVFAGNLNNDDTVVGGEGTDALTATVTGLTATTGKLNISGVETITLTTSGANTLDLSGVVGATTVSVSANTQTITGLNLATKLVATSNATLKVTAADATGANDTLTVEQKVDGNVTNVIEGKAIENLSLILNDTGATVNNATFTVSAFEGSTITVAEAATTTTTGTTVALGNLHKNVTSVNTSGVKGAQSASAAASTAAVTFSLSGAGAATVTGSDFADTFNISESAGVDHAITGGTGNDVTNIAIKNGYVTGANIATETVNYTVRAGDSVTLTGVNNTATTAINLKGGNSLSVFTTAANGIVNELKTFNSSEFGGNVVLKVTKNIIDDTVTFTGGVSVKDEIEYQIDATGTDKLYSSSIEILDLNIDETSTLDLSNATDVLTVDVDVATGKTFTIDKMKGTETVLVTDAATGNAVVEAKLADATGASDAITFELKAASAIADSTKLKTTDVETVTVKASTDETIDLSELSMTAAGAVMTLKATGDKALTVSALNADVTTVDASGMATGGSFIQTGRSSTANANYIGSAGNDTFIMTKAGDVIDAGAGTGDTLDINYGAVIGGINIDLSSTVDQVVGMDGTANSAVQKGFENVDLAGHTGFGAVVTGSDAANRITGTASVDNISAGKGDDTIVINTGTVADNDVMDGGEGTDTLEIADGLTATIDGNSDLINVEVIKFLGAGTVVLTGQTEAFTINAAAAGIQVITSGSGADTIDLEDGTATDVDVVILDNAGTGLKNITGFDSNEDIIKIGGDLKTALDSDTTVVEGDVAANTNAGATYAIETAAIGWVDEGDNGTLTVSDLTDLTKIATALNGAFEFADAGSDATLNKEVFVVESDTGGTFGVYVWTQSAAGDATVAASELVHIATIVGTNLIGADIAIV